MDDATSMADSGLVRVLERSKELGFLGPGSVEDHVEHARAYLPAIGDRRAVVDLGSGGGVPGLVLALLTPLTAWTLVDAMTKRCRFLDWAVDELELSTRVEVRAGRAEALAREAGLRHQFDAVVSRSFGPPAVTAECAVGFLRAGGRVVVSEPPESESGERWPRSGLELLGLEVGPVLDAGGARVQVLDLVEVCGDELPRRDGVPAKRPLF